jgi:hypothetical protein
MKITLIPQDKHFVENIQSLYKSRERTAPSSIVVSFPNNSAAQAEYVRVLPLHLVYGIKGDGEELVRLENVRKVILDWFGW